MLFDSDYERTVAKYLGVRGPSRKRAKSLCKKSGHRFIDVTKEIIVWPFVMTIRRQCVRCGKRQSTKKVTQ